MTPLTAAEIKTVLASILDKEPDDMTGWAVIGMSEDGPVILSNARDSAVIIYTLSQVIERLASFLADGKDMQAEAQKGARE